MNLWQTLTPQTAWQPYEPDREHPWNLPRAQRLLRRAGFGPNSAELVRALALTPGEVLDQAFDAEPTPAVATELDRVMSAALATNDPHKLAAAWLYRMLHSPAQATEKITLFWHGHFATSAAKVTDPRLMLEQHELLRRFAWGPFSELTLEIARNPAMLIYLDSATNRRTRPNENFAREIMELFCLGLGHYTEHDIQELARCFTGWEVHQGRFRFYPAQHDRGVKEFLGRRGEFEGEEGVRVVLEQPAAARFIARKLVQYYLCDEPTPPDEQLEPLAEQLRAANWSIKPVVRTIVGSRANLASPLGERRILSPVEQAVAWCRALEVQLGTQPLQGDLTAIGQSLFHPPNVKGWPGGRTWLNSATVIGRANLLGRIAREAAQRTAAGSLERLAAREGWTTPEQIVEGYATLLLAQPLEPRVLDAAIAKLRKAGDRSAQIADLLQGFALLPEVHLS